MTTRNRGDWQLSIGAPATFVDRVRPDGVLVRWESRHHRKHQKPAVGSMWWAPGARGWWIAILFAIGSLLFAIGSVPGYTSVVGAVGDTVTYFIGSLFFTTASFFPTGRRSTPPRWQSRAPAFFVYQPRADRLVGDRGATRRDRVLTWHRAGLVMACPRRRSAGVWRPDAIGSVCFLVPARWLASSATAGWPGVPGRGHGGSPWPTWSGRLPSAFPRWPVTSTR